MSRWKSLKAAARKAEKRRKELRRDNLIFLATVALFVGFIVFIVIWGTHYIFEQRKHRQSGTDGTNSPPMHLPHH